MAVQLIPEGYHNVTPYLSIKGTTRVLDFYKQAFGVIELVRIDGPNGTIAYAEIRISDSSIMMSGEVPGTVCASPDTLQSTSVGLMIYVPNVGAVFVNALKAGGMEVRPAVDQFYGDRSDTLKDPFGHTQTVSTHVEDATPDEMARRMEKWTKEQAAASARYRQPSKKKRG